MKARDVYLCIVTWPDGRESLLMPRRPGEMRLADTVEKGRADFEKAISDFACYVGMNPEQKHAGTSIRLICFQSIDIVEEHRHLG